MLRGFNRVWWRGVEFACGAMAVALVGCNTRDRLTFPNPGDGMGPVSIIDQPAQDTAVMAGPGFFFTGLTADADGVDTVYFVTLGGLSSFPPYVPNPTVDTVRFGLPITTQGLAGDTITLLVFGTDGLGNRGDTAIRQIVVQ